MCFRLGCHLVRMDEGDVKSAREAEGRFGSAEGAWKAFGDW